jgi:predicted DNA-binding transcriptional regulator YafY
MASKARDGGRNAQLRRMLNMLRELSRTGTGFSLAQLSERYGTDERTIRRDLDALREEGFPIVSEKSVENNSKLWRLDTSDHTRRLNKLVDVAHYMALRVAMGTGGPVRNDTTIFSALEDLHAKIETVIGERGRAQLKAIDQAFLSYEKQAYLLTPPDVLWLLVEAITARRLCRMTYRGAQHAGHAKTFVVLPLRIFAHTGTSHLMCYVPKHASYVPLNLQRLEEVKLLDETAQIPDDFDSEHLEESAFGLHQGTELTRYVMRFDPEVSVYIRERLWHKSQELEELPDGSVKLTFTCGASWEVDAWVASWRHWVHVFEPATLQEQLHDLGVVLAERYAFAKRKPRKTQKTNEP